MTSMSVLVTLHVAHHKVVKHYTATGFVAK